MVDFLKICVYANKYQSPINYQRHAEVDVKLMIKKMKYRHYQNTKQKKPTIIKYEC